MDFAHHTYFVPPKELLTPLFLISTASDAKLLFGTAYHPQRLPFHKEINSSGDADTVCEKEQNKTKQNKNNKEEKHLSTYCQLSEVHSVPLAKSKNAKETARCERMRIVTELLNITANDFEAKSVAC